MRPLTLHASALNDDEYDLYTTSLNELVWADDKDTQAHDDAYYEQIQVGVREARGWLRGRYVHLPPGVIDAILRFFSPRLSQTDVLTGGQMFAVLRLVVHAENGKDVDRALAFVQAHPSASGSSKRPSIDATSPPRDAGHAPPTPASSSTRLAESQTVSNPFSASQPPTHPSQRPESATSAHTAHNPFVARTSTDARPPLPPRKPPPPAPPHSVLTPPPKHGSILLSTPSRKSISPTRPSSSTTPVPLPNSSAGTPSHHPPIPPKPAHVTSTLMKQSLQASKAAQTMKRAEEQLERERVLQVLKSSAVVSGTQVHSTVNRSVSPVKVVVNTSSPSGSEDGGGAGQGANEERGREGRAPPLPRRRHTHMQQQPSPPISASSLEHVALARASTDSSSENTQGSNPPLPLPARSMTNPFPNATNNNPYHRGLKDAPANMPHKSYAATSHVSPSHGPIDLPSTRPPTHPDRKPPAFPFASPHHHQSQSSPFHDRNSSTSPFASPTQNSFAHTHTTNANITPESSPTTRVFRSKSLHHPSPPFPPLPAPTPPRRKRPESVQVLGSTGSSSIFGEGAELVFGQSGGGGGGGGATLARHTSMSAAHRRQASFSGASTGSFSTSRSDGAGGGGGAGVGVGAGLVGADSPLHKLAKSWQPRLEKARYKAEAGLSRRGYIRDQRSRSRGREDKEELLVVGAGAYGDGYGDAEDLYEPPSVDGLSLEGSEESEEGGVLGGRGRQVEVGERDGMKWPVGEGEGWRPL
ncbi:hypothetical protein LshimejAT787_0606490 [Lyophyllum shimeji]|uniref:Uncharacterized protein n=1 Tax=Lyophyllum shimeji TaxID=47721 RepID=A0A9P3PN76_LYOSH|nr:hypothetical protein LshimejAT787_0606490 [Lyophyllum shimeji]